MNAPVLAVANPTPPPIKLEGWLYEYPAEEGRKSAGFGYASDMLAMSVNKDDPLAFMYFLEMAGGLDVEVLIAGDIVNYAATHGATECVEALFKARPEWKLPQSYYLDLAAKPVYGPNALRKTLAT